MLLTKTTQSIAKGLLFAVAVLAIVLIALVYFFPAPPSVISIAAGVKGGAFEPIANSYRERLARENISLDVRLTNGVLDNIKLLEDPLSGVDAAFLFGGITNVKAAPRLMSLGRIHYTIYWIFYRGSDSLQYLAQLKGKRIAAGGAAREVALKILSAHGVTATNATFITLIGPAAGKALRDGEVDVVIAPQEMNSPFIQSMLRDPSVRLMALTQAEALTRVFPFLVHLVLPQGVVDLERNVPAQDINLVATTSAVVVRKDLHPDIVYVLAQTLSEEHNVAGVFQKIGDFPMQADPEFPVAYEALEFYKNGPSILQRYAPFSMINLSKRALAVLLAVFAVVLPLFNYAPKLYRWMVERRARPIYVRLRTIERELQAQLTPSRLEVLQGELEEIEKAASGLSFPMKYSDLLFGVKGHINFVRNRLANRLAGAQKEVMPL